MRFWHIVYTAVTHLPSSRGRILLCWISVMCSKPNSLTPFSVFSLTSPAREAKDVSSNAPERLTFRESAQSHNQIRERWRCVFLTSERIGHRVLAVRPVRRVTGDSSQRRPQDSLFALVDTRFTIETLNGQHIKATVDFNYLIVLKSMLVRN